MQSFAAGAFEAAFKTFPLEAPPQVRGREL
jgi:hypothetical protein